MKTLHKCAVSRIFTHTPIMMRAAILLVVWMMHLQAVAAIYRVGDQVESFSLRDRATGKSFTLSDFAGKIVVLDWFAWWCPFCQAAAPQLLEGIKQHYTSAGGNPDKISVLHVGVNLQSGQETQTQNFVNRAGYDLVLEDFNRAVANRFASGGQPIFAVINGVTNSPTHAPWQLLYSRQGYGQTVFPINEFRDAIDSVKAPPPEPPTPPRLSAPEFLPDGQFRFLINGKQGVRYQVDQSHDLQAWLLNRVVVLGSAQEEITIMPETSAAKLYYRVKIIP